MGVISCVRGGTGVSIRIVRGGRRLPAWRPRSVDPLHGSRGACGGKPSWEPALSVRVASPTEATAQPSWLEVLDGSTSLYIDYADSVFDLDAPVHADFLECHLAANGVLEHYEGIAFILLGDFVLDYSDFLNFSKPGEMLLQFDFVEIVR
mgnify:CR=1 FL=1